MAAREIHDGVNELVKATILEVEKILKRLPQKGDRVDVITASSQNNFNQNDELVRENKNSCELLIDQRSSSCVSSTDSETLRLDSCNKSHKLHKAKGKVLSDSVRVTPLENAEGMLINMVLCLKEECCQNTHLTDICIECPDFKPHRMRVDGSWFNIV